MRRVRVARLRLKVARVSSHVFLGAVAAFRRTMALAASSSKDRRSIMEHPLCPSEVEAIVAAYDAAKAEEAEARKAERAAEREEKERAKFEELRRKFGGSNGAASEAVAAE